MSGQGEASLSRTSVAGSEEDFDVTCDPCDTDGQRVQATGHCIDCNENLCISCMKVHKKMKVLKGHDVRDKATLSHSQKARATTDRSLNEQDPLTDKCPNHPEELIKFYCNSDHTLGCSVCIPLDHRSCKDISYIRDVSRDVENSEELKKIQTELRMFVARLSSLKHRTEWIKQTLSDGYSQVESEVRNLKKEIIDLLDQLEGEILEKAASMTEKITETLDGTVYNCGRILGETEEIKTDIEKKKSMNQTNRVFISMKIAQDRLRDLADEANHLTIKSKCERLCFQPDEKLAQLSSTLTSLGTMLVVSQPAEVKAMYQHGIDVKYDTETKELGINGLIVLPDGRLALTETSGKSVRLVDASHRKASYLIMFKSIPIDLTLIEEDKIAVTVKDERYIQILSVSPVFSKCHTIAVPGLYTGVTCIPDRLILCCKYPIKGLHVCDMYGVLMQQIETDYYGNKLFTFPTRIAISPDHGVLYVTDHEENAVVSLTLGGKLINKYVNDTLKKPVGIAVDDDGRVYVCSEDTHSVHLLSPSGHQIRILLVEKDIWFPFAIAYSAERLFIDSGNIRHGFNVHVYRLTQ